MKIQRLFASFLVPVIALVGTVSSGSTFAQKNDKISIPLSAAPSLGQKPAGDKPAADSGASVRGTQGAGVAIVRSSAGILPATALTGAAAARVQTTPGGVKFEDREIGKGFQAREGSKVTVQYSGWIMENGRLGKKFDSSFDRGDAFTFQIGAGRVIPGWEQGISGMRVGGTRILTVPPEMAYKDKAVGTVIPPNATLVFEVRLLGL